MGTRRSRFSDILHNGKWSIKKKARQISVLLHEMAGNGCPVEVFALIMGQNVTFCHCQSEVIEDVLTSINEKSDSLLKSSGFHRTELINFLVECRIMTISLRLIATQIKFTEIYQKDLELPLDEEMKTHLLKTRLGCLIIVSHVLAYASLTPLLKEQFANPNIAQTLIACIESEQSGIIICSGLIVLKNLIYHYKQKKFFDKYFLEISATKIARLMHRDVLSGQIMNWLNKGITQCEYGFMTSLREDKSEDVLQVQVPFTHPKFPDHEIIRKHAIKWACHGFFQCGLIVFQLVSTDISGHKYFSRSVTEDEFCLQGLVKWINVPTYHPDDLNRIIMSVRLLGYIIVDNETVGKKLLQDYNIEKCLEIGVRHANVNLAQHYIVCVGSLCSNNPSLRHHFVENQIILQAIIRSCFSAKPTLQEVAICTLHSLLDKHTTPKIMKAGFGRREILKLKYFYDLIRQFRLLVKLRRDMEKYINGLWKCNDDDLMEEIQSLTHIGIAEFKAEGNDYYNRGNYEVAIKKYTEGIKRCAPTVTRAKVHEKKGSVVIEVEMKGGSENGWYPTPAALYSNRAQCYLSIFQYEKAIDDCDMAILLSDPENDKGKNLLLKSTMRRSTACFELKRYTEALADIGFCLLEDQKNINYKIQFTKTLSHYYQSIGPHNLVQRCAFCLEGEGDKLKRCAKCEERYCSRKCQVEAWKTGHKNLCRNI